MVNRMGRLLAYLMFTSVIVYTASACIGGFDDVKMKQLERFEQIDNV